MNFNQSESFWHCLGKNVQNVIFHSTYCLTQHYVFIYFNVESSDIFKFWHKLVNDRPLPQELGMDASLTMSRQPGCKAGI